MLPSVTSSLNLTSWGRVRTGLIIVGLVLIAFGIATYCKQQGGHCKDIHTTPFFIAGSISLVLGLGLWYLLKKPAVESVTGRGSSPENTGTFLTPCAISAPPPSLANPSGYFYDATKISLTMGHYIHLQKGSHMDPIFDNLYLGDIHAAYWLIHGAVKDDSSTGNPTFNPGQKALADVEALPVDLVVSVGVDVTYNYRPHEDRPVPSQIEHIPIAPGVNDHCHSYPELIEHLPKAVALLKAQMNAGKRVFIHCQAGISRSVAVVVFYLMQERNLTLTQALGFVQSKRAVIEPSWALLSCLQYYQDNNRFPTREEFTALSVLYQDHPVVRLGRTRSKRMF